MQALQAGQNRPVGVSGRVIAGVSGEPEQEFTTLLQAGAVLLGPDGRIGHAEALASAEQPRSPDGSVVLARPPGEFQIDLESVPASVARIAIVLAVKPALPRGATFSVFSSIRCWLADMAGKPLLLFPLPLASRNETAMILAELYRYQGLWKFRAVGQGFAAGLPALAAHFGVQLPEPARERSVEETPARRRTPGVEGVFSGTGFCIHPDGYWLTNYHVIADAGEIIGRSPRHRCTLELVFADPINDLALLRASAPPPGVAVFRDGPSARPGESVVVVGYPLGGFLGSGPQVTTGNLSSLIGPGDDTRFLQFTAPTQAGNSGGPLLDGDGAVIGVVSSKLNVARIHEMTGDVPQNVNFAIKMALARSFLEAAGIDCQSRHCGETRSTTAIAAAAENFVMKIECRA